MELTNNVIKVTRVNGLKVYKATCCGKPMYHDAEENYLCQKNCGCLYSVLQGQVRMCHPHGPQSCSGCTPGAGLRPFTVAIR